MVLYYYNSSTAPKHIHTHTHCTYTPGLQIYLMFHLCSSILHSIMPLCSCDLVACKHSISSNRFMLMQQQAELVRKRYHFRMAWWISVFCVYTYNTFFLASEHMIFPVMMDSSSVSTLTSDVLCDRVGLFLYLLSKLPRPTLLFPTVKSNGWNLFTHTTTWNVNVDISFWLSRTKYVKKIWAAGWSIQSLPCLLNMGDGTV